MYFKRKHYIIYKQVFEEVTAEIHPFFINLKNHQGDLSKWLTQIQDTFTVTVDDKRNTVTGSFDGIVNWNITWKKIFLMHQRKDEQVLAYPAKNSLNRMWILRHR